MKSASKKNYETNNESNTLEMDTVEFTYRKTARMSVVLRKCICGNYPKISVRKSRSYDPIPELGELYVGKIACSCGMQTAPVTSYGVNNVIRKAAIIWNDDASELYVYDC